MQKKGILIDATSYTVERDIMYDDKRIDGLYYKCDYEGKKELIPIAYIFPKENEAVVRDLLLQLATSKKAHDDLVAQIYYKEFPKLR